MYFTLVQHSDFNVSFQLEVLKDMQQKVEAQNATGQNFAYLTDRTELNQGRPQIYGTQVLMNVINEMGALPTRNHRDVQFEEASRISGEAMHEKRPSDGKTHLVANAACFGCTIACGRISKIDETHFSVKNSPKYWGANGGLEYEAAWALGAANGVGDLEALQYANLLCNEHGMDPISFGATVGAAMELYDLGILSKEQIGLDASFGSAEALCKLVEMTAAGEGFGKDLGMGSARMCAKSVSYTHLRAHETVLDLVCRLLLEKKN